MNVSILPALYYLTASRLGTIQITDSRLGTIQITDSRLGTIQITDSRLGTIQITASRLGTIQITDSRLGTIQITVNELNPNKTHGCDNISIQMLQLCAESIHIPLGIIFTNIVITGIFPDQWKLANVTPIHKKMINN